MNKKVCPVCGEDCRGNEQFKEQDISNKSIYRDILSEAEVEQYKNYEDRDDFCGVDCDEENMKKILEVLEEKDNIETFENALCSTLEIVFCSHLAHLADNVYNKLWGGDIGEIYLPAGKDFKFDWDGEEVKMLKEFCERKLK